MMEYSARSCPAAADKVVPLPLSGLPGHRGQSGETGDGLAVNLSEFGQFGDQAVGGDEGDTGGRGEYPGFLLQFGIRVDPFPDGSIKVAELVKPLFQLLLELFEPYRRTPVQGCRAILGQGIASGLQFVKILKRLRPIPIRRRVIRRRFGPCGQSPEPRAGCRIVPSGRCRADAHPGMPWS